jgi:hypothetical protein
MSSGIGWWDLAGVLSQAAELVSELPTQDTNAWLRLSDSYEVERDQQSQ